MTPREELALLQQESKPSKHGNVKVYTCPECWKQLPKVTNKINKNLKIRCLSCFNWAGTFKEMEKFDSLAEHTRGLELKMLKRGGMITDLEHHKVFKLVPKLNINGYIGIPLFKNVFLSSGMQSYGDICDFPHAFKQYEADFTYKMKGEKVVEEAKRLTKIEVIRTKVDRLTCEPVKIKEKVDFPRFVNNEDFRHFRKICLLMLVIHGHRVQVRADGTLWMFTDKLELERVHGRIK